MVVHRSGSLFVVAASSAILVLSACNRPKTYVPAAATPSAPVDPWVLTTIDPNDKTPALLWNGLLGFRIERDGGAKGQSFFAIDQYETTGEEKIQPMSSPLPTGFLIDGKPLPVTGEYRQTLDMRTSELTTHWVSGKMTVECVTILHPTKRMITERWTVAGADPQHYLDFDLGTAGTMGQESMLATDVSLGPSRIKGKLLVTKTLDPNPTVEFNLVVGPSPDELPMAAARGLAVKPKTGWDRPAVLEQFPQIQSETRATWAERWKTDIEIDGPVEDQQAVRSFLFYLRSAIAPQAGMSISPFGLSNDMYNGHVFWDADTWVFPALMLIDPLEAKAITDYRLATLGAAEHNPIPNEVKTAFPPGKQASPACKYAWESSVSGSEVAPDKFRRELHINGDVVWSTTRAAELGLERSSLIQEIADGVLIAYRALTSEVKSGSGIEIKNVMSPDENHTGDNDLYTNLLAQWVTNGETWHVSGDTQRPLLRYILPHDDKSFLTYDNDKVKSYKQAAAILSIYPLQYPPAEKQAKIMMDRFADKVIRNGPAMSDSVNGVIWARLGEKAKAYQAWRNSWQPFTHQPLMLFSEKRTKAQTYFATGAAGSLQTVLFGFLGFRLDSTSVPAAIWSKQLEGGSWLSIKPNLPENWKSVKLKNFAVLGHKYTLTETHSPGGPDIAEVTQGD